MLANKNLVMMGGTTGLGLSAAGAFLGAGARVVVMGRNPASVAQASEILGENARAGWRCLRCGECSSCD